jgi:hypothetical protein
MISDLPDELLKIIVTQLPYYSAHVFNRVCTKFNLLTNLFEYKFEYEVNGISNTLKAEINAILNITEGYGIVVATHNGPVLHSDCRILLHSIFGDAHAKRTYRFGYPFVIISSFTQINRKAWKIRYIYYHKHGENIIHRTDSQEICDCKPHKINIIVIQRKVSQSSRIKSIEFDK